MTGRPMRQVWFGASHRPLYGWLHVPEGGRAGTGVVLCSPMGEEGRSAHRTFRRLAESIAAAGMVALRFDYDGTGDSAGAQDDPDRLEAWLGSIREARTLLDEVGVRRVHLVGMRLGATMAAQARIDDPEAYADLVLWDPCSSGTSFLREGQALHALSGGAAEGGVEGASGEDSDDGLLHTPGFQYTHETVAELKALNLARLPGGALGERVLLLEREDRSLARKARERLQAEGDRLEVRPALDQSSLMDLAPSDCLVPERALAGVVDWLTADPARPSETATITVPGEAPARFVTSYGDVVERSVRLGSLGLYGVVTEPATPPLPGEVPRPWVVFVNVAVEHHIGPGRRWVDWARELAGLGFGCVRIDQSSVGDSPNHRGQRDDELFSPWWIDDMQEVVHELGEQDAPICLVGLCSGGYSALEVASWRPVDAIFAVNPRLTLYEASKITEVYSPARRAALIPTVPVARLAERRRTLAGGIWRAYRQVAPWHAPVRVLRAVARTGCVVRVLSCRQDHNHFVEVAGWWLAPRSLHREGRLDVRCDERVDHSLLTRLSQDTVRAEITDFLRDRYGALLATAVRDGAAE